VTLVIGAQWGDEGKGRIVDFLAAGADVVGRFGGGANAGHTVRVGDKTYKLRIVPSGVLAGSKDCIIGPGTVVSLEQFTTELAALSGAGVDVSRVWLSDLAHLILPYHIEQDRASERALGSAALGTTGNGIGPAYVDRAARRGVRAGDLRDLARAREVVARRCAELAEDGLQVDAAATIAQLEQQAPLVLPHVRDTVEMLHRALQAGKRVIAEGAQGALLDVTFGTYPYVTSSLTVAGGAGAGLGFGPTEVEHVIGVAKAYATRVGGGPFPTELNDATGERLRERGGEYGTVTGRARRCGWIDAVALRYVAEVSGLTHLAITKLDVLDGLDEVSMCTAYENVPPASLPFQIAAKPKTVLRRFPGWPEATTQARTYEALPVQARAYLDVLAEEVGVSISYVSVGPERSQIIVREGAPLHALTARA
ncbi:MAG: adenylosuccinate synthase, partial [Candidatus Eremiobacteraeota bacterium]|nr:adenylosuccinate synthase [Candidatus Eremiobacteraeota bacterium]